MNNKYTKKKQNDVIPHILKHVMLSATHTHAHTMYISMTWLDQASHNNMQLQPDRVALEKY